MRNPNLFGYSGPQLEDHYKSSFLYDLRSPIGSSTSISVAVMPRTMAMPTLTAVVFIVMAAVVVVAVIVVMMVAAGIRVISEVSFGKGFRRSVCRSLNAGIELDACI